MTAPTSIQASCPTRVDLAGGTIDIWPAYLFFTDSSTVNCAIDLRASVTIQPAHRSESRHVRIESLDRGSHIEFSHVRELFAMPEDAVRTHPLCLPLAIIRAFPALAEAPGFSLVTKATSHAGAGLGGSSTLGMAILGAVNEFSVTCGGLRITREAFVPLIRNIETTILGIPAGVQDYYGALCGSVNRICFDVHGEHVVPYPADVLAFLKNHMAVFFTGKSRNSGINNWTVFRGFFDRDPVVRQSLTEIAAAAVNMHEALLQKDIHKVASAMTRDWEARRRMASGISTPTIDAILSESCKAGALAGKVCGAGGGGCMMVLAPSPDRLEAVRKAACLVPECESLSAAPDASGLVIQSGSHNG